MCTLYERIMSLCKDKGVSGSRMCLDLGLSKSTLSDMKSGRKKGLSTSNAQKIANYLGVSVDYLLGVKPSEWCSRFRNQLSKHLEYANREDVLASCADIQELWSIAEGNSDISFDKACEIADILGVSIDYLLGKENNKAPAESSKRSVNDDDIKFALFGGDGEITDEMYDEVKRFAEFVKQRGPGKK